MKSILFVLLIAVTLQTNSAAAQNSPQSAYNICVETCYAWTDRGASTREIKQCVEQYCTRLLPKERMKMAELPLSVPATPMSETANVLETVNDTL